MSSKGLRGAPFPSLTHTQSDVLCKHGYEYACWNVHSAPNEPTNITHRTHYHTAQCAPQTGVAFSAHAQRNVGPKLMSLAPTSAPRASSDAPIPQDLRHPSRTGMRSSSSRAETLSTSALTSSLNTHCSQCACSEDGRNRVDACNQPCTQRPLGHPSAPGTSSAQGGRKPSHS
jgi:hypothetical protein